jgi:type II secretory pathway component PulC
MSSLTKEWYHSVIAGLIVICAIAVFALYSYQQGKYSTHSPTSSSFQDVSQSKQQIMPPGPAKKSAPAIVERVSFKLMGVVVQDKQSLALLSFDNGSSLMVAVGDVIPSGLEVVEVRPDHLVLRRLQEFERLSLRTKQNTAYIDSLESNSAALSVAETPDDKTVFRLGNENLGQTELPDGINRLSENQYMLQRDYITEQFNSTDLYRRALIEANDNKEFTFKSIQPGAVFDHLGFRIGDTIAEVNGNPITTIRDVISIRDDLNNTSEMNIKILRNNKPMSLYYYLD